MTWEELAIYEIEAAQVGGRVWREFVVYAERLTGRPWAWIREAINPYVEAEYRKRGLL